MVANTPRYGALLLMLLISGAVSAQATVADIDKIQSDTLKLRAQAIQAKAQKDLTDIRNAGVGPALQDASTGLPVARGVFGGNGSRYVSFLYANGGTAEAPAGGKIPGDYIVRSFDETGVVLTKAGRTHRIPFSMQAPTPAAVAPTLPAGGMPFGAPSNGPVAPIPPMR